MAGAKRGEPLARLAAVLLARRVSRLKHGEVLGLRGTQKCKIAYAVTSSSARIERGQHREFGVTVGFNDLRDDDLIPIEPVCLFSFCFMVLGVFDQFLQGFKRLPVVNIADQSCTRVFPCFFTKIAWNFFCGFGDRLIKPIELAVELLLRKNECR
jgi:hypothetical protein